MISIFENMFTSGNPNCFKDINNSTEAAVRKLLIESRKIVIFTHKNPDGDAIGSALGLTQALRDRGKDVHVVLPDSAPGFLRWLPAYQDVVIFGYNPEKAKGMVESADLVFCLDFGDTERTGKLEPVVQTFQGPSILLDHHPACKNFASHNFVYTNKGSTAEIVFSFLDHFDLLEYLNESGATCLLTGIITDTLGFKVASSNPDVFEVTMKLMALGANKDLIFDKVYNQYSADRMQLLGFSLSSRMIIYEKYQAACIYLSIADLERFNHKKGDTEGFVNYPLSMANVRFSVLFTEQDDCIKLSLRSKPDFAVNQIAKKYYEGGGHRNAAGGKFFGTMSDAIKSFENILQVTFDTSGEIVNG
ncbi:MAG: bifunctional oligoribonuclease/PAP phosphatase NrnA [Bacteroidetes bacterium]|nr:bifunctional oligoribonuclease/PAP phosphatase NrnA [Bacteroidota bacterium]